MNIAYYIGFLLIRTLEIIITAIPRSIALRFGYTVGLLLYYTGFRKNVVRKNMLHVQLCPPEAMDKIIKKTYCTTAQYAVDFLRDTLPLYRVHNFDIVEKHLSENKGMIAILAHFGNWELLAKVFGSKVKNLHVIAKSMNNPHSNAWVEKKRNAANVFTIYREQALRKMFQALTKNSAIAILIDQYAGKQGTNIPFLGMPSSTVKTVAGLIHKTSCPAVSTYAILRDDKTYDIYIHDVPPPSTEGMSNDDAIRTHQILHNEILSSWIRQNPEHYFGWFHKRYKDHLRYAK